MSYGQDLPSSSDKPHRHCPQARKRELKQEKKRLVNSKQKRKLSAKNTKSYSPDFNIIKDYVLELLKHNKPNKALKYFNSLYPVTVNDNEKMLKAVILIQLNKTERAKELLKEIAEKNTALADSARKYLYELK